MKTDVIKELEAIGCEIVEYSNKTLIIKCPVDILRKGLKVSGVKSVKTEKISDDTIKISFEK